MKDLIEILLSSRIVGRRRLVEVRAGQRVRLDGEPGIYTVLRVDPRRHLADILREGDLHKVEAGIPVALLHALSERDEVDELKISA
jgi:hypothetical protein